MRYYVFHSEPRLRYPKEVSLIERPNISVINAVTAVNWPPSNSCVSLVLMLMLKGSLMPLLSNADNFPWFHSFYGHHTNEAEFKLGYEYRPCLTLPSLLPCV